MAASEQMRDHIFALSRRFRACRVGAFEKVQHFTNGHVFWWTTQDNPFWLGGTVEQIAADKFGDEFFEIRERYV
jgi:hypothetical protein